MIQPIAQDCWRKRNVEHQKTLKTVTFAMTLVTFLPLSTVQAQSEITPEQAYSIGIDAYTYFYPLLTTDITRRQFTNIEPGKEIGKGPMNMFVNVPEYPPADFKGVVRSTLTRHSVAWLDLTKGSPGDLSTGHRRTFLPPANARHVDGCLCLARLADNRHTCG